MTKLVDYLQSAARGIIDMDKRAGTYPRLPDGTLRCALLMDTLVPILTALPNVGYLQLTHQPRERQFTTVTDVNGDVVRVYGECGFYDYDACDTCGKVYDTGYLDCSNECEDCVDKADREASERFRHGACDAIPDDTPCLDTSFHDHEMDI